MCVKTSIVSLVGLLSVVVSYAQKLTPKHRLVDESGVGVGYAAVIALRVADSSIVASTIADGEGRFELSVDSLREGRLRYEFSCPGYARKTFSDGALPPQIVMESVTVDGKDIGEVVVAASKTSFTVQGDRYVFRLSDDLEIVKNSTVYDILKITPLVRVDDFGESISILGGGGTQIYINGRRNRMSSSALVAYLKGIPATSLSNIEVMPVANSTYAGEGIFGVIDIKLRKRPDDGVSGMASISVAQAHSTSESANVNLDIRKKKIGANVSLWGNNSGNSRMIENTDVLFLSSNNRTNTASNTYDSRAAYGANVRLDYDISDRQVVGVVINADFSNRKGYSTARTIYGKQPTAGDFVIDSLYHTGIDNHGYQRTLSANLNYQIKTDSKGSRFSIDADYVDYMNLGYQTTQFDRLKEDGTTDYTLSTLLQRLPQKLSAWTAKAEYNHVFGRWGSLSVGGDFQATTNDDDSYYAKGAWENKDANLSNHFTYTEILPSLFASYSVNWTDKFSTTLGGRMEYTYTNAEQRTNGTSDKTYRMRFLPSAFLSYVFNENHQLSYSISNRLSYPPYEYMNSFRVYTSPDSYREGNPYLKPARNISQRINYMYKGKLGVYVSHSSSDDAPRRELLPNGSVGVKEVAVNWGNDSQTQIGIEMYGSYFNDYWQANNSVMFVYMDQQGITSGEPFRAYSTAVVLDLNNMVILSKKHQVLFTVSYYVASSSISNRSYNAPVNYFSAGLRKGFGEQWYLSINWFDIFNQRKMYWISYNNGIEHHMRQAFDTRQVVLKLAYRFGGNIKSARQRRTSADDIKGRL